MHELCEIHVQKIRLPDIFLNSPFRTSLTGFPAPVRSVQFHSEKNGIGSDGVAALCGHPPPPPRPPCLNAVIRL